MRHGSARAARLSRSVAVEGLRGGGGRARSTAPSPNDRRPLAPLHCHPRAKRSADPRIHGKRTVTAWRSLAPHQATVDHRISAALRPVMTAREGGESEEGGRRPYSPALPSLAPLHCHPRAERSADPRIHGKRTVTAWRSLPPHQAPLDHRISAALRPVMTAREGGICGQAAAVRGRVFSRSGIGHAPAACPVLCARVLAAV